MRDLKTPTGKSFQYKGNLAEEIIVYPSDKNGNPQDRFAMVITPYVIKKVKSAIQQNKILMGASRDDPPLNSLGHY